MSSQVCLCVRLLHVVVLTTIILTHSNNVSHLTIMNLSGTHCTLDLMRLNRSLTSVLETRTSTAFHAKKISIKSQVGLSLSNTIHSRAIRLFRVRKILTIRGFKKILLRSLSLRRERVLSQQFILVLPLWWGRWYPPTYAVNTSHPTLDKWVISLSTLVSFYRNTKAILSESAFVLLLFTFNRNMHFSAAIKVCIFQTCKPLSWRKMGQVQ